MLGLRSSKGQAAWYLTLMAMVGLVWMFGTNPLGVFGHRGEAWASTSDYEAAQGIQSCTTTDRHERWQMKNRTATSLLSEEVMVQDVIGMEVPFFGGWRQHQNESLDLRENEVVKLTGHPTFVKLNKDDCDIHVEVTDSGTVTEPSVIVEIPLSQPGARKELSDIIKVPISSRGVWLRSSPKVRFTGWLLFDVSHQTFDHPKVGKNHGHKTVGTILEVHPVFKVEEVK